MRHQETIERVVSVHGTVVEIPKRFDSITGHEIRLLPDKANHPDAATAVCAPKLIGKEMFLELRVLSANSLPCNGKVLITLVGETCDPLKPRITDPLVWLEHEDQEIGNNRNNFNKSYAEFIKFACVAERRRRRWVKEQKQKAGK